MDGRVEQEAETCQAIGSLRKWYELRIASQSRTATQQRVVPVTSLLRQQQSSNDQVIQNAIEAPTINDTNKDKTVLYLGYGSNLCAETFKGKRNIQPLSQVNVVVPALSLTFDLPGIPYTEPCFGNVRYRNLDEAESVARSNSPARSDDYHKDRWSKGLVGVVYEVTMEDYAHIIATEGGGAGYKDVMVDCYALNGTINQVVPLHPEGQSFKAHTLFDPQGPKARTHAYAQPSARYLKLITDGAAEHALPQEYQDFLNQIRSYRITTTKQRLGQFIFMSVWSPFFLFFLSGAQVFLKPDGTYPKWLATFLQAMFVVIWKSYDRVFKPLFGDGERTLGDGADDDGYDEKKKRGHGGILSEKTALLDARTKTPESYV
ncbi:hypothetical protein PV10_03044 [Exophiala mesophila]|uniref:gamma-glutamylcyclotransferase n=1 Tax=Exophiala mesophila TaxID=212818 RepID=A0A0D1X0S0_EXOME|nr:uncharacterized protein PV10_03044 [Exophiala mesophila]KIV95380.1 hypothetical protein PV10_03044 [Exophiala mesophila]